MTVRELRDALTDIIEKHPDWAHSDVWCGGGEHADESKALRLHRYDWSVFLDQFDNPEEDAKADFVYKGAS